MKKIVSFFTEATPLKLVLISFVVSGIAYFIEKPLPSIFLGLRLAGFLLFIYAVIKYFNKK
ncbi:MAG: hypothetical protein RL705_1542 [Bacteroidota bacterium]|jgi:hypothetical protein